VDEISLDHIFAVKSPPTASRKSLGDDSSARLGDRDHGAARGLL
jgi:hypothetical protein